MDTIYLAFGVGFGVVFGIGVGFLVVGFLFHWVVGR